MYLLETHLHDPLGKNLQGGTQEEWDLTLLRLGPFGTQTITIRSTNFGSDSMTEVWTPYTELETFSSRDQMTHGEDYHM